MKVVEGWETKRFDEFGMIISGSTPSTSIPSFWGGDIVWVTPNDLSKLNTPYLYDSGKRITEKGLNGCSAHLLPARSLVMSSRAPIGYVALPTVQFCTNQGCKTVRLKSGFHPEFVYYNVLFNIDKIKNLGEGTTFSEISGSTLSTVEIAFPSSKHEQTKIAEILSTVDRAIEQTEALIAKQQRIKNGLMQDLLTCGIDEHGNLRSEETHKFIDSPLGRIPVEWEVETLGQVIGPIVSGWSPNCDSTPAAQGEWAVLKTTAVIWEGYDQNENKRLPSQLAGIEAIEVQSDDILITRKGPVERVGVVVHVDKTRSRLMIPDTVFRMRLRPDSKIEPAFVPYALGCASVQSDWFQKKIGLADAQVNLNHSILNTTSHYM